MTGMAVVAAVLFGLVIAGLGVSFLALLRTQALAKSIEVRSRVARDEQEFALGALRERLDALAARMEEIRIVPHASAPPLRRGLNLSRRSQALRMHRRGESAGEIATELGIPVQEVELLIKVHEIVMSTV